MSTAEVIPIHNSKASAPRVIQLTTEERLELENVQMKLMLIELEVKRLVERRKQMIEKSKEIRKCVDERTGADLTRYVVDLETGTCKLQETSP